MKQLIVLHEHPKWQEPLFEALKKRDIDYAPFDLKTACFDTDLIPEASIYFNQASPSAYLRGNTRAVPLALSLMRSLEISGARILNGSKAFSLELSKSNQASLMQKLGIDHPRTLAFNCVEKAIQNWNLWPALLKPEQGGSGARMYLVHSPDELRALLNQNPDLWLPENLLLLQEYFPVSPEEGIIRMEFLGGELLYAMKVVSHGAFNLCPSTLCNPEDGTSECSLPVEPVKPVEFFPYPEITSLAVIQGQQLVKASEIAVGGIEFLKSKDGRLIFYDINANSNLRPSIAQSFGFDPFERVVDFLEGQIERRSCS